MRAKTRLCINESIANLNLYLNAWNGEWADSIARHASAYPVPWRTIVLATSTQWEPIWRKKNEWKKWNKKTNNKKRLQ